MQENKNVVAEISDIEAYKICVEINSQLMALSSGGKVGARHQQYQIIEEELQFLSKHYHGTSLNSLLEKILKRFNSLEKEIKKDLSTYKTLYGDPENVGDGFC